LKHDIKPANSRRYLSLFPTTFQGGSGPVDYSQQYLALSHTLLRLASSLSLTSGGGGGGGQGSTPVNLFADGERSIQHCVNQSYLLVSSWPSSSTLDDFTAVSSYVSNMDAQLYDGIIRGSSRGGGSEALDPLSPLGRAHINSLLTVGIPIVDANEQVNSMMLEPIVSAVADGQATSFVIDLGLALRSIKLQAARAFKAELDRLSRLAQLAQQMDALLVNKSFLAQLLSRWRNLDFVSIRRATEWASIGTRLVDTVFVHFPTQLYASSKAAPMSPSVSLANWFKQVYRQCADVAETVLHTFILFILI